MKWLQLLVDYLWFIRHWTPTIIAHLLGRWYVFRDRPDWFVIAVAQWDIEDGDDTDSVKYIMEARKEIDTRLRRLAAQRRRELVAWAGEETVKAMEDIADQWMKEIRAGRLPGNQPGE